MFYQRTSCSYYRLEILSFHFSLITYLCVTSHNCGHSWFPRTAKNQPCRGESLICGISFLPCAWLLVTPIAASWRAAWTPSLHMLLRFPVPSPVSLLCFQAACGTSVQEKTLVHRWTRWQNAAPRVFPLLCEGSEFPFTLFFQFSKSLLSSHGCVNLGSVICISRKVLL